MYLTIVPSKRAGLQLSQAEPTPDEFLADLASCPVGEKDGLAIIPARFDPCPIPCRGTGQVDCGGGAYHRLGANVAAMTALGIDLDHLTPAAASALLDRLHRGVVEVFWWETYSHTAEAPRLRLLFPFKTDLPLRSAKQWSEAAWPALVAHLELDKDAEADHACRDPSRIFYLPRKPTPSDVRECGYVAGDPLDWAEVLGDTMAAWDRIPATPIHAPAPLEDPTKPVDLQLIRAKMGRSRRPTMQRLAKGQLLTPLPHDRQPGDPSRYEAWREATAVLSMMLEGSESTDAVHELLRPSYQAEQRADPGDATEWETIENLLERARASAPERKARRAMEEEASREFWSRMLGRGQAAPVTAAPTAPATSAPTPAPATDWAADLDFTEADADGRRRLRKTARNLHIILSSSPAWAGVFRKNLMANVVEVYPPAPILAGGPMRQWLDTDTQRVLVALAEDPNVAVEWNHDAIFREVCACADDAAYDPLMDYLRGVKWDGTPRLDTMLEKYFGCAPTNDEGESRKAYLKAVGSRWMISAAARGLRPGCQADAALIFEGSQGAKKTTALRTLGREFYAPFAMSLEHKDAQIAAGSYWIGELGELSSLGRSGVSAVKHFLTVTADVYRAPYGRATIRRPRRLVLAGSTNDAAYLTDHTGNRRFWPVTATKVDDAALARDRDQLWAEAVHRLEAGEQWHLTPEEEALARPEAESRMKEDAVAEAIVEWVTSKEPAARPTEVRALEVAREALGVKDVVPDRGMEMRVAPALLQLGFTRRRKQINGRYVVVYATPGNLLGAGKKVRTIPMGNNAGMA